jgi:D-sedoheptulose 7-phosphate isomerase
VLLCGNGGSAADAQHIAAEFVGRFKLEREGLPAVSLTTDTSILTSLGNDFGFEALFCRQVEALGRKGDVLIGLSTSGTSKNVLRAFEAAERSGLICIAFCGQGSNPMVEAAQIAVQVPSSDTPRIQEGHAIAGHILCDIVERTIQGDTE